MPGITRAAVKKLFDFLLQQCVVKVDDDWKLRVGPRQLGDMTQIGHPHPQINLHQPKRERIRKNLYSNKMKRKFWTEPGIIPETIAPSPHIGLDQMKGRGVESRTKRAHG